MNSAVADHTALIRLADIPVYRDVLLAQFNAQRSILAIPTIALLAAARFAADGRQLVAELTRAEWVVRWVGLDIEDAVRIGLGVPMPGDASSWPLTGPIVDAALGLKMPILTAEPHRYRGYPIDVLELP